MTVNDKNKIEYNNSIEIRFIFSIYIRILFKKKIMCETKK